MKASPASDSATGGAVITSLVAGRRVESPRAVEVASWNPARLDELVGRARLGDETTFADAARVARAAQRAWASTPAPRRGRVIQQIGRIVEANKEPLAQLITREIGKPLSEARGEVQEVIDTCDFFVGEGRRLYGHTIPSEMPYKQLFTFRVPVGVAAIITAGNFPVAVPAWYLVPALLCGNAVVWKPADYAPVIADAVTRLFLAGGLPAGVLNMVLCDGDATMRGLSHALERRVVDKVGFTGSTEVGSKIAELCGRHLQSPCLELGGKNPLVIMPDADLDLAVEGAVFSGFGSAGQRCTSLGTVVVHESVHANFLARFVAATHAVCIGNPTEPVLYGPMISRRFADGFERSLELIEGHHEVHGSTAIGRITSAQPRRGFVGDPDAGLFYHPVVVDGCRPEDALLITETFGPIVGVTTFSTVDEAIDLANAHGYGLSAAIYTDTPRHAFEFRERVSAGMLSINNSTSGAEAHLPFGGNARSGNGSRLSGVWVLDQFTRWQAVNWDYAGKLQLAQIEIEDVEADLGFRLRP